MPYKQQSNLQLLSTEKLTTVNRKISMIFPLVSCCSCVNNPTVLKATQLLVSSSRSDYMTLLPNGNLYATEIMKIGSSQYTNNI